VTKRMYGWALMAGMATLFAASTLAFAQDASVLKDLTAVIALNGQSCDQVVSAVRQGESDYLASCKDGNRYRVFTNAQGRVVVEKRLPG
jgi:hypothetical protein